MLPGRAQFLTATDVPPRRSKVSYHLLFISLNATIEHHQFVIIITMIPFTIVTTVYEALQLRLDG